ncbi:cache domain-containing sensor histidine kinase [Cohnella nanjingensis]|uniref:Histidine kinase n=1 Tax=Cohnella nanjingensis TaxID=1387779 RepID=A0A7X0VH52_9BACL|nr:histidine kinase [Cohnella nanjingensis]MBB6673118.1 histidine kinase [Cohnella nanjingensis]
MFKRWRSQRLMNKAILFASAFILVPMLLIFWFGSGQATLAIKQQVGKALFELNKQNHATMDRVLDSIDQTTVAIMGSEIVQQWRADDGLDERERVRLYVKTEKLLADYTMKEVKYSLFVFTDRPADYDFAPSTDISESGVFFVQAGKLPPWLNRAIEADGGGAVQIINRFGYRLEERSTVAFARAILDYGGTGKAFSILVATQIDNVLKAEMNSVALPDGAQVFLTDGQGKVLAGSAPTNASFAYPNDGKRLLPNVETAHDRMYIDHVSSTYANRLVYEIPLRSLIGSHNDVQEIIQITAVCYFLVILAVLFYFGKSLLQPMARLASLTRSYEPGRQPAEYAEVRRKDEIGFVFRSFYLMTDRLNQLIKEKYVMEIKQKESELMLMHSQITPHLLYNTLDSIYWYGIRGGVPEVAEMVRDLSTLLRIGLSRGKEIITIREELNHVEAYLHLQEKRYQHSFRSHLEVDEAWMAYLLPKVIVQPLVENAILHGVGKMDGEGEVWIRVERCGDDLAIVVEDNGFRPVDFAKIEALLSGTANPDQGFGIRNVHRRVQLRFGPRFGLSYAPRESGGARAVIRLPAIRDLQALAAHAE